MPALCQLVPANRKSFPYILEKDCLTTKTCDVIVVTQGFNSLLSAIISKYIILAQFSISSSNPA
jgi:hypothetical protein